MMGFKQLLAADVGNTFMNPEEFGEKHTIDGKLMTVIVDGLEVVEREKKQREKNGIDGIYEQQIIIYVARSAFGKLPASGRQLIMDNCKYRIEDSVDEGGIYSITLGAIKS